MINKTLEKCFVDLYSRQRLVPRIGVRKIRIKCPAGDSDSGVLNRVFIAEALLGGLSLSEFTGSLGALDCYIQGAENCV